VVAQLFSLGGFERMTNWTFVAASVEGDRLEISGIRVWDHKWVCRDGVRADIKDPSYGLSYSFHVYEIVAHGRQIIFAAGEFSASVYGFYIPAA
jgi:hypothetical protein